MITHVPSLLPLVDFVVQVVNFCKSLEPPILCIGWSPLCNGGPDPADGTRLLDHPVVARCAKREGLTPAQVLIMANVSRGVCVVPKADNFEQMQENFDTLSAKSGTALSSNISAETATDLESLSGPASPIIAKLGPGMKDMLMAPLILSEEAQAMLPDELLDLGLQRTVDYRLMDRIAGVSQFTSALIRFTA